MKKWTVIISQGAEEDINGIYEYIAGVLMEPMTAGRVVIRIKTAILKLDTMPERYRLFDGEPWHSKGLRLFAVGNYVVFYHIAAKKGKVFVDAVIYGRRYIEKLLEELEFEEE